jgi:GDP-4-dehydro-6-deoxy-D-mannose reductase
MSKVLVTGSNGFVGTHLLKELRDNNIEVVGVGGPMPAGNEHSSTDQYYELDLSSRAEAEKIDFSDITGVIHLAGLAAVGPSFENPMNYITTNIGIQTNLFEVALAQKSFPKFLVISSGSLYDAKASMPLTESSSVIPSSPYAVSKIGQEQMAGYYGQRGFTITLGPVKTPDF